MPLQVFDRINSIYTSGSNGQPAIKLRSMPIFKYFEEMKLTAEQKKERIALAEDLEEAMLFFFSLVLLVNEYSYMQAISTVDVKRQLRDKVYAVVGKHTQITDEMREHLDEFIDDVNDTTTEHLIVLQALMRDAENTAVDTVKKRETEEFFLSDDRARLLGEEEANTIFNGVDFVKAKRRGYKYKTWITMRDSHVRLTHQKVDDVKIPINELFMVGNSFMKYPRDPAGSLREISGCRCSMRYSK